MSLTKVSYSLINGAPFNVLDYGAKGDGTTDDTAAFQAAATGASGSDIRVPAGTYKITGNTDVAGNFMCSGDVSIPVVGSTTVATNVRFGLLALSKISTGKYNTAVGRWSMANNNTGEQNSAYGVDALYTNTSGSNNVACGSHAMTYNTTGSNNVGIGVQTLEGDPAGGTGDYNVAIGAQALSNFTSASSNVAIGANALISNTTGGYNVAIGALAGYTGTPANANTTGSTNVWIGYGSGPGTPSQLTNSIAIGNGALVSAINSVQLGSNTLPNMILQLGDASTFKASLSGVIIASAAPATASSTGDKGTITWDSSYIYVCVATNTWKRVAITTW